jgi:hypothetical protein
MTDVRGWITAGTDQMKGVKSRIADSKKGGVVTVS